MQSKNVNPRTKHRNNALHKTQSFELISYILESPHEIPVTHFANMYQYSTISDNILLIVTTDRKCKSLKV